MNCYFNAEIFEKVLEYVYLRSIKSLQRCNFLFPEIAPLLKKYIEVKEKDVQWLLCAEIEYQESVGYVREGEEAKKRWFSQLRKDYNLPSDYKFE
ncbi:hypothetical protein ACIQ2D_21535 [Lysinibacillus sp. NPDC097287]|uniref:hypothetical protein n=1 Tax=Lysinibacillus sp. NPDC097287 TaxID=3364144 RepID=UPI00382A1F37